MTRFTGLHLIALGLLLGGCAPKLAPATSGRAQAVGADMAELQRTMAAMQTAQREAAARCAPLKQRQVPWEEERLAGHTLATRRLAQLGPTAGEAQSARVALVGHHLARFTARPASAQWVFGVFENDKRLTWTELGGYVFISTGLLATLQNEAQLAGVLAHEMTYLTRGHRLERYREVTHQLCVTATQAAALSKANVSAGGQAQLAPFAEQFVRFDPTVADGSFAHFLFSAVLDATQPWRQAHEVFDADAAGLEVVAFAGYDPAEYGAWLTAQGEPAKEAHLPPTAERVAKLETLRAGALRPFATGTAKPPLGP